MLMQLAGGLAKGVAKGLVKKPFFSQEVGQIASATTDLSGLIARDTSEDQKFKTYMNLHGLDTDRYHSPTMLRMMRQNMQDDEADGRYKDGQFINQLPKNYGEQEQEVIQDNKYKDFIFYLITELKFEVLIFILIEIQINVN